jgi:arylsulfatase A-like enzyme
MQGMSLIPLMKGEKSDSWRNAIYYHYYEYPGWHMVKRHYGIRTERYKLIHFYYDIDEWELYDLLNDPHEMNNLYGKEGYEQITSDLKNKLEELRIQYKDTSLRND